MLGEYPVGAVCWSNRHVISASGKRLSDSSDGVFATGARTSWNSFSVRYSLRTGQRRGSSEFSIGDLRKIRDRQLPLLSNFLASAI
jgi:hypothetical protein